jgi:hypothetical protein
MKLDIKDNFNNTSHIISYIIITSNKKEFSLHDNHADVTIPLHESKIQIKEFGEGESTLYKSVEGIFILKENQATIVIYKDNYNYQK